MIEKEFQVAVVKACILVRRMEGRIRARNVFVYNNLCTGLKKVIAKRLMVSVC